MLFFHCHFVHNPFSVTVPWRIFPVNVAKENKDCTKAE